MGRKRQRASRSRKPRPREAKGSATRAESRHELNHPVYPSVSSNRIRLVAAASDRRRRQRLTWAVSNQVGPR